MKPTKTQREVLTLAAQGLGRIPISSGGRLASVVACCVRGWLDRDTWHITPAGRAALTDPEKKE